MQAMKLCSRGDLPANATNGCTYDMRNEVMRLLLHETRRVLSPKRHLVTKSPKNG